jgi:hypothetical protein
MRMNHNFKVRWGPWEYTGEMKFDKLGRAVLLHMKGDRPESIPLFFDVAPACHVEFGQRKPPAGLMREINHGWSNVEAATDRIGNRSSVPRAVSYDSWATYESAVIDWQQTEARR